MRISNTVRNPDGTHTTVTTTGTGLALGVFFGWFFGFVLAAFALFWPLAYPWPLWAHIVVAVIWYPILFSWFRSWSRKRRQRRQAPRTPSDSR